MAIKFEIAMIYIYICSFVVLVLSQFIACGMCDFSNFRPRNAEIAWCGFCYIYYLL